MSFMKKNAGFTLVELIVVIAILGILAGVAIPTYSGYIEKAQIAGDQQELHNVNLAFAAACAEAGESNFGRTDVSGGIQGGKFVYSAPFAESFGLYYPAADAGEFKVMTSVVYDPGTGAFVDNSDGTAQLKQYLNNSSYKNLPLTDLTGDVSDLVGELADFFAVSEDNRKKLLGSGFEEYLTSKGMKAEDLSNTELANAAAVYLTSKAAGMTDDDIKYATAHMQYALDNAFTAEGNKTPLSESVIEKWSEYTGSNLASYAMLYATAEAVALANGGKDGALYQSLKDVDVNNQTAVINAATGVLNGVGSDALKSYLNNQAAADMEAYFKALQTVNGKENDLLANLKNENLFTESDSIQDLVGKLGG